MLRQLQFTLRQRLWGRFALRRGLPCLDPQTPGIDETAYYELLLTAVLGPAARSRVAQVVDVGCRNWSYVPALARSFPGARLVGIEVDGLRRHLNGYRRLDYAYAHAKAVGERAQVHPGNFLDLPDLCFASDGPTLVLFLFPFVSIEPCLAWGLPPNFVDYASLLTRARRLLTNEGSGVLGAHQGKTEAGLAHASYERAGLTASTRRLHAHRWQGFWPSVHDSYLFLARQGHARSQ